MKKTDRQRREAELGLRGGQLERITESGIASGVSSGELLGGIGFGLFGTKGKPEDSANTDSDSKTNSYVVHRYAQCRSNANPDSDT